MKKRVLIALLAVLMIAASVFGLTACNNSNDEAITNLQQQITALENENKNLSEKIDKLEEENKTLSNKIDNLENDNDTLLNLIKWLKAEIQDLTDRIDKAEGKPVLDKSKAAEIKEAYYNLNKKDFGDCTADNILIRYYGEYNGSYVMFIDSVYEYAAVESSEIIDGVLFNYSSGQRLNVYNEGNFYTVGQAFGNGLLTHDDLVDISYKLENDFYTKK